MTAWLVPVAPRDQFAAEQEYEEYKRANEAGSIFELWKKIRQRGKAVSNGSVVWHVPADFGAEVVAQAFDDYTLLIVSNGVEVLNDTRADAIIFNNRTGTHWGEALEKADHAAQLQAEQDERLAERKRLDEAEQKDKRV